MTAMQKKHIYSFGEEKQMKTIVVLLISCFLLSFCSKRDNPNEEKQKTISQEPVGQEIQEPEVSYTLEELEALRASYVFDIDSFRFINEFPRTIAGIKAMYPDEPFEEKISKNTLKGYLGDYVYSLISPNIEFIFWGNSIDDAVLNIVEIFQPNYQCKTMQIIGMSVKYLENISGKKLTMENNIRIYTDPTLYFLVIETQDGIVSNYAIVAEY
jgi:hypothetical protein